MLCFLQFAHDGTLRINCDKQVHKILIKHESMISSAIRRSRSEPIDVSSSSSVSSELSMKCRTNPASLSQIQLDDVSIESSFNDYCSRIEERRARRESELARSQSSSQEQMEQQVVDDDETNNNLHIDLSENEIKGTEIEPEMAKLVNYEQDIQQFIENSVPRNQLFADPFASPTDSGKKSRTEQWIEENQNQSMETVSSSVTETSLKRSKFTANLKEATEAKSDVDVSEVDRFWDYLYKSPRQAAEPQVHHIPSSSSSSSVKDILDVPPPSNITSNCASPVKTQVTRDASIQTINEISSDQRLLRILLDERDRAARVLNILPSNRCVELSDQANYYQIRYRAQVEMNKKRLERRIDEVKQRQYNQGFF